MRHRATEQEPARLDPGDLRHVCVAERLGEPADDGREDVRVREERPDVRVPSDPREPAQDALLKRGEPGRRAAQAPSQSTTTWCGSFGSTFALNVLPSANSSVTFAGTMAPV